MHCTSRSKLSFFSFRPQAGGDMTATVRDRPPHHQRRLFCGSRKNPASTTSRLAAGVVGVVTLVCALTSCTNGRSDAAPTKSAPAPSVTATPSPDEQAVLLSQYRKFWTTLAPVSRMAAALRRAELAKVAVDPELKSLLAGMLKTDAKGQVFYGAHVPRATTARISPDAMTGLVNDCQDSTKTGLATRSTMTPVTAGVARNHVVVTMKKAPDGLWKVAFVSYTKTPC